MIAVVENFIDASWLVVSEGKSVVLNGNQCDVNHIEGQSVRPRFY